MTFFVLFIRHEVKEHSYLHDQYQGEKRDAYGYYYCRQGCGLVFSTRSIRNRHMNIMKCNNPNIKYWGIVHVYFIPCYRKCSQSEAAKDVAHYAVLLPTFMHLIKFSYNRIHIR